MVCRHTDAQVKKALLDAHGRPALAARILGVSRQAMHARLERNPHLRAFLTEYTETLLDIAEIQVIKRINAGDLPMSKWYAERKGRARGYGR